MQRLPIFEVLVREGAQHALDPSILNKDNLQPQNACFQLVCYFEVLLYKGSRQIVDTVGGWAIKKEFATINYKNCLFRSEWSCCASASLLISSQPAQIIFFVCYSKLEE